MADRDHGVGVGQRVVGERQERERLRVWDVLTGRMSIVGLGPLIGAPFVLIGVWADSLTVLYIALPLGKLPCYAVLVNNTSK